MNAVAIAPSNGSIAYAGGQAFLENQGFQPIGLFYRSGDGGDHWTAMASAGFGFQALAVTGRTAVAAVSAVSPSRTASPVVGP